MIEEIHRRAPSAGVFMARAFLPGADQPWDGTVPPIVERWTGLPVRGDHLSAYRDAIGHPGEKRISALYPHVLGFRLQMALLTHRSFPLPIWRALQVRNRLVRHRHLDVGESLDLETRCAAVRRIEKGLEVDLHSALRRRSELVWESTVTYFYRGKFDAPHGMAQPPTAPGLSQVRALGEIDLPRRGGWRFGALTGDYNGVHWSSWYARRMGFGAAFLHPQRAAGICLSRLALADRERQVLNLWIKGPLYYGGQARLHVGQHDGSEVFGLCLTHDPRMALVGSWRSSEAAAGVL
jgi:hypothetical protein